ncbi:MAG TPA: heme lyase CcmF/NrfE family subunit [Nevskiaceae bacterium]|nr:heme lyase CcmF/NrfE family subunit [Nevskiaceae bacterium]
MIPELGHYALILALGVAMLQVILPIYGWRSRDAAALAAGPTAALTQGALVALAYFCLTWSFVHNDFSVLYVASNSHSELPLMYRITAVWGAHEGSILLWLLMLSGWSCAVVLAGRRLPADILGLVSAVLGLIGVGFLLFLLITSNPFARLVPAAAEGRDLNPLLQDPGMAIHPPMLYMGYVGFSVAFAFSIAALLTGRLDSAWMRWTRPWTTLAWTFLTMGITLGSWWAYNELGWGGWWFWDPVENASFMPWLVGTALIHSLAVTEKRGLLKSWTVLLAILAFALSLLGTFLVRSGVLVSVHAFASDPARGIFILAFLAIMVGGALGLYAWRGPKLVAEGELPFWSREFLLLLNNIFLVVAAAAVLAGTLSPIIAESFNYKMSVGPPFFGTVFPMFVVPLLALVAFASVISWKRGRWDEAARRMRIPAFNAVLALALPWLLEHRGTIVACAGATLAVWVIGATLVEPIRRIRAKAGIPRAIAGMTLAHLGLGVWALGVAFVSSFSVERDVRLAKGASASLGGYEFTLNDVQRESGPNYDGDRGSVSVRRNGASIAELAPEKRLYHSQGQVQTESAVDHNLRRDLYVSLGEAVGDQGEWTLRLYYKPMMRMVWLGGVLMFLGGLLAATDRRYRLAAARHPAPADALTA